MDMNSISQGFGHRLPRMLQVSCALVLLSFLAGCGPKLEVGFEDPSFRSPATLQRPIAVGGVVWSAEPVEREPEVNAALEELLWKRLSEDIGTDRVKHARWVSETLDSADRAHVLQSLDASGSIDSLGCDRLCSAFRDSSVLIVFGRLVEDKSDTSTSYPTTEGGQILNTITRTVRVILEIYDPVLGRDVWRAQVSNKEGDSESVDGDGSLGETLALLGAAILVEAIFGDSDEEEPPPVFTSSPELIGITWDIYGKLGKVLAGKE